VLLVDDHDVARRALVLRLRDHPQLEVAGDTADALEAHDLALRAGAHAVLVDPVRADGLGLQLVSSLCALPEATRPLIVVHLSYFRPELWEQARSLGAQELALKQIAVDALASQLLRAVIRCLPRERWAGLAGA